MSLRHRAISDLMGVTMDDVNQLVNGRITGKVSARLGVPPDDLERFMKGEGTAKMAESLRLSSLSAVDELAGLVGRDGATGILLAMLISN